MDDTFNKKSEIEIINQILQAISEAENTIPITIELLFLFVIQFLTCYGSKL